MININKIAIIYQDECRSCRKFFCNGEFPAGAVVVIPSKKLSDREMFLPVENHMNMSM